MKPKAMKPKAMKPRYGRSVDAWAADAILYIMLLSIFMLVGLTAWWIARWIVSTGP
jgi:hypothetical protein